MKKITCGLEIHQQLNTSKLFCKCDSKIQDKEPIYTVMRKLRAVVGETGEIDIAAAEQAIKGKKYCYECYDENCCLIELDEEPPRNMNKEALKIGIQAGKLLKTKFADEVQVMRKTVVDGSNTTGFQRTALVGYDGKIESSEGEISIPTVIVEEDSGRLIRNETEVTTYRLDRLGIPLLEISTGPDIHSPEQCQEVSEKLGLLLRSLNVKRGQGTIRQDVNVSIPGGERVEIKGAQDLRMIPTWVRLEAERQEKLLEIKEELKKRGVKKLKSEIEDLGKIFSESDSKVIKSGLENGTVLGAKLEGYSGLIGKELQPRRRFGTELSERAKSAAGVKGIFHSDELPNYGITEKEIDETKKKLKCKKEDAFILVAAEKERAKKAITAALNRAAEAITGVPNEVRGPNADGTTSYNRMMPGAARMYPETDVLPTRITKELLNVELPELISQRIKRYVKILGKDLAKMLAKSGKGELFDRLIKKCRNVNKSFIAETLATAERTIRRETGIEISPSEEDYEELFIALDKGKIAKESVLEILKEKKPVKEILEKYKTLSDKEIEKELKKVISENKGAPFNALIGKAMTKLRGKAPGKKIAEKLKRLA